LVTAVAGARVGSSSGRVRTAPVWSRRRRSLAHCDDARDRWAQGADSRLDEAGTDALGLDRRGPGIATVRRMLPTPNDGSHGSAEEVPRRGPDRAIRLVRDLVDNGEDSITVTGACRRGRWAARADHVGPARLVELEREVRELSGRGNTVTDGSRRCCRRPVDRTAVRLPVAWSG